MLNILYYSEPHPLRNSYSEHGSIAKTLVSALKSSMERNDFCLRVFSNNEVVDLLIRELPDCFVFLQRPTRSEAIAIDSFFGQWNEAAIQKWIQLVRGGAT